MYKMKINQKYYKTYLQIHHKQIALFKLTNNNKIVHK